MNYAQLTQEISRKQSMLCVGLDVDPDKMPAFLPRNKEGVWTFLTSIVDATVPYAVAFKPNTAFFEAMGTWGWELLAEINHYIKENHPGVLTIADAKRGDIGNTSARYAKAFLQDMGYDAITIAPYMGHDSVQPFLGGANKWGIVLGLTSNPGADDLALRKLEGGKYVFEQVLENIASYGSPQELMVVMGATRPEYLRRAREILPHHFFLVPGVGAQGGSMEEVVRYGANQGGGLLINASRSVIYAGSGPDYAAMAALESKRLVDEMHFFFK